MRKQNKTARRWAAQLLVLCLALLGVAAGIPRTHAADTSSSYAGGNLVVGQALEPGDEITFTSGGSVTYLYTGQTTGKTFSIATETVREISTLCDGLHNFPDSSSVPTEPYYWEVASADSTSVTLRYAQGYILTLDANGGSFTGGGASIKQGASLSASTNVLSATSLAIRHGSAQSLNGWMNEAGSFIDDGGTVGTLTQPETLRAVWGDGSSGDPLLMTDWDMLQYGAEGGEVKLVRDITASSNDTTLIFSNSPCTIDLNGFKLDGSALLHNSTLSIQENVTLKDSSTKKTGKLIGNNAGTQGDGGAVRVLSDAFTLQSGTIVGGENLTNGGAVYVGSGTFSMTGGTITGGSATNGGGVFVASSGTFTMNGGTITANNATDGGGVYVESGGAFETLGQPSKTLSIEANTATRYGGGVCVADIDANGNRSSVTLGADNSIQRNSAQNGGGVYIGQGQNDVTVRCTATGNEATANGGGVYVSADATLKVSSEPDITGNKVGTEPNNVYLPSGTQTSILITIGGALSDGARIGVSMETPGTFTSGWTSKMSGEDPGDYFSSDNDVYEAALNSGSDEAALQTPWTTLNKMLDSGGTVQLAKDYKANAAMGDANLTVPQGKTVTLDLNGHVIDRGLTAETQSGFVILVSGSLTLTDSNSTATHTPSITYTDPVAGGSVTVVGGVITGGYNNGYGGGVYVDSNGTFTMAGGSIVDNHVSDVGNAGGGVYAEQAFTMSGGSISGNTASDYYGGGVYVNDAFIMSGGTISGNTASSGGGVYAVGAFTMSGDSTISSNKAGGSNSDGGGVYAVGAFTMSGDSTISGNTATARGSGVFAEDGFTMTGGEISGNTTVCPDNGYYVYGGGGVYINATTGSPRMSGGEIKNNRVENGGGGGVYVSESSSFELAGGTISGNSTTGALTKDWGNGGGVYVAAGAQLVMGRSSTGVISGNSVEHFGGGVYVAERDENSSLNALFTMQGGTISNNSAGSGAGVYIDINESTTEPFTMTGGEIKNNTASENGGGVNVFSAKVALSGGTISGNTASDGGGIYIAPNATSQVSAATLRLTGGAITNNTASEYGGGVCAYDTTVELSDSPNISGNKIGSDNSDLYMMMGNHYLPSVITITGPLTYTAPVGVASYATNYSFSGGQSATYETFTSGWSYYMSGAVAANYFTCDNNSLAIVNDGTELALSAWAGLQDKLDRGGTVTLDNNYIARPEDAGLTVSKVTATLDLGGYTIDRGLASETAPRNAGYVISVDNGGSLSLKDSVGGGKLTGGYNQTGGGVLVYSGSFAMESGTITGCRASISGGGVFVDSGSFALTGGSITQNTSDGVGGGVCLGAQGTLDLSGAPTVKNNTANGATSNVYLEANGSSTAVITVVSALTGSDGSVGVSSALAVNGAGAKVVAAGSGYTLTEDDLKKLAGDDSAYSVLPDGSGGAGLYIAYTLSFDANGGTGTMATQQIPGGAETTLTKNAFTREQYSFNGWNTKEDGSGTSYDDEASATFTADTTLYAQWTAIKVTGVTLGEPDLSVMIGATGTLTATVSPDNALNKDVTWSSDDESIATVDASGVVTGVAEGTTTITVETVDGGFTASCTVTVTLQPTRVTGVALDPSTLTLTAGETGTLSATLTPGNAANQNVTWTSNNANAATVDANGVVTAVAEGTATITVETEDGGFTASCTVTVTAPTPLPGTLASGTCGGGIEWSLSDTGELVFILQQSAPNATGVMENYSAGTAPWFQYRGRIESVTLGYGVKSVGSYAFYACGALREVFAEEAVNIGSRAFAYCAALEMISSMQSGTPFGTIGEGAFYGTFRMPQAHRPTGSTLGDKVFELSGIDFE